MLLLRQPDSFFEALEDQTLRERDIQAIKLSTASRRRGEEAIKKTRPSNSGPISSIVSTNIVKHLIGGMYNVNGAAENAIVKNSCNILFSGKRRSQFSFFVLAL
ncbi:unnamed protein product [Brassica rapa subsp. trilocularis]